MNLQPVVVMVKPEIQQPVAEFVIVLCLIHCLPTDFSMGIKPSLWFEINETLYYFVKS